MTTARAIRSPRSGMVTLLTLLAALLCACPALAYREYTSRITGTPTGTGSSEVPFKEPQGIAIDGSNDLWVSDIKVAGSIEGEGLIDEFGPSNEFVEQGRGKKPETAKQIKETKGNNILCSSTGAKLQESVAEHWRGTGTPNIAFGDANGHLYIEDTGEDQIWVMNKSACVIGEIFPTPVSFPMHGQNFRDEFAIAVDNSSNVGSRGDVYVAATTNSLDEKVFRIAGAGEGPGAAVPAPFSCSAPYVSGDELALEGIAGGLAVDPGSGDLFVTVGNAIEEFDPSGCFVRRISEIDDHSLSGLGAIAVDPISGHLLVADNTETGVSVDEFSLASGEPLPEQITEVDGTSFGSITVHQGDVIGISDLAVNSSGDLYVSDGPAKAVYEFGHFVPPPEFLLTVEESGTGTGKVTSEPPGIECPSTCSTAFPKNGKVKLKEEPALGSKFAGWTGCDTEEGPVCKVTMSGPRTVKASFETESHPVLKMEKLGTAKGKVTSEPPGIECPSTCSASFPKNELVTLTEEPTGSPEGSTFVGWAGCDTEEGPGKEICKVTMSDARTITARFEPVLVTLDVLEPGLGSGIVKSEPPGIECPFTCSAKLPEGSIVKLMAKPALGSTFKEWSGCETTEGPGKEICIVKMIGPGPIVATAIFEPISNTLLVSVIGNGTVGSRVGTGPGGISGCTASNGTCSAHLEYGEQITLTEKPNAHQTFKEWSGACTGSTRECLVTMTEAKNVTAIFQPKRVQLEIHRQGSGAGTVTSNGSSIDCGSTCAAMLEEGTRVSLSATPAPGSVFSGWTGEDGGCSSASTCETTLAASTSITAVFTKIPPPPPKGETKTQTTLIPAPLPTTVVIPPSNRFTLQTIVKRTQVTLRLTLPGPGTLTIAAPSDLRIITTHPTKPGTTVIALHLTSAATKALSRHKKLRLGLIVSYTPAGGTTNTITKAITLTAAGPRARKP